MTIEDIRRDNLVRLSGVWGSQAALARAIGKDKNQVNQWLGKGTRRNLSSIQARNIESRLSLPRGYMDKVHK
jgi:DNA-binding transcriptional regulator YdaS (Cro superfamily)